MTGTTELIARLVVVEAGHVLAARSLTQGHAFLPGGHVDFAEGVVAAIRRECAEELGVAPAVGALVAVLEQRYHQPEASGAAALHYEVNLVFAGHLPGIRWPHAPASLESHLRFEWLPLGHLAAANLLPAELCDWLPAYARSHEQVTWLTNLPPAPTA